MKYERKTLREDVFHRVVESIGYCSSDWFWIFSAPLMAINLISLLVASHQAYVARKISTEFAETDYISRAMSLVFMVALLVIPISLIVGDDANVHFFVIVSFVSTVALSLLLFIFIPKIIHRSNGSSITKAIRSSAFPSSFSLESAPIRTESDNGYEAGDLIVFHPQAQSVLSETNDTLRRQVAHLETKVSELSTRLQNLGDNPANSCNSTKND